MHGVRRETLLARTAYADFLGLGRERNLRNLQALYLKRRRNHAHMPMTGHAQRLADVPTVHLATLKRWSQEFGWQARIDALARRASEEAEELRDQLEGEQVYKVEVLDSWSRERAERFLTVVQAMLIRHSTASPPAT